MPAWIVPAAIAAGQLITGLIGQNRQNKYEKSLARYQADMNEKYLAQQNEYNSPANQMLRFQQAGLNPNLVYGQGSPGNQNQSLSYPTQRSVDQGAALNALLPNFQNAAMTQAQIGSVEATTRQKHTLTALNNLQARVLERNPLLDAGAYNAIIDSLKSAAEIKANDASLSKLTADFKNMEGIGRWQGMKLGEVQMFKELELLEQKFNLGVADQAIKAQVLQSKEFQNALSEIQVRWMKDAEVTPQHILQFIQLLLLKLL